MNLFSKIRSYLQNTTTRENQTLNLFVFPVIVMGFHYLLYNLYLFSTAFNESIFHNPSLLWTAFQTKRFVIINILMLFFLFFCRKISWYQIDENKRLRILFFSVAFILTWTESFYPFNYYYNYAHLADRICILLLLCLFFWKPTFIFPLLLVALAINKQFDYPFDPAGTRFEWTNRTFFFELLILFASLLFLFRILKFQKCLFVYLPIILILVNYFLPGWAKLAISPNVYEWTLYDKLGNITTAAQLVGWNVLWDVKTVGQLAYWLNYSSPVFTTATVLFEVGSVFALFYYRLFWLHTLTRLFFHVLVFVLTGDTFWNWIVLEVVIGVVWLKTDSQNTFFDKFGYKWKLSSLILVLLGTYFFHPKPLGWYDTKYFSYYEYYAIGESGKKYEIDDDFFAPYEFFFVQSHLHFFNHKKTYVGVLGATYCFREFSEIEKAHTNTQMNNVINNYALNNYDDTQSKNFLRFINAYFKDNNPSDLKKILRRLHPPWHMYTFVKKPKIKFDYQEKVKKIQIIHIEKYLNVDKVIDLDSTIIQEIYIKK